MTRCAECGKVECDKNTCPGWNTELQEVLVGVPLMNIFPTETPADRHRFIPQLQQQPFTPNSCCQRNRDGKCCEHFCKCNRQKCRWDGK